MSAARIPFSSYGLRRLPLLGEFLQREVETVLLPPGRLAGGDWLGWGAKQSARRAQWYARQSGGRAIQLEDGFLRSYGTGEFPPLSLVVDELGIYYDSTRPSSLEQLLASDTDLLAGIAADVARAKQLLLSERLSKYNHAPLLDRQLLREGDRQRVLVIDQTAGDLSVSLGAASGETFAAMLAAARRENPEATIYVKTHPEVTSGHKGGYLTQVQDDARTVVLRQAINPLSLIEQMERIYVVTSTMGFEALLAGKPVSVFGLPWYAGWGVTDDRQRCPRRTRQRSVTELFAAAYFHYARYLNPLTHRRGTIFDVIDWLVHQREVTRRFPGRMVAVGFPRWRAFNLAPLLSLTRQQLSFVRDARQAAGLSPTPHDALLVWGRDAPAEVAVVQQRSGARLLRVEDGFIRSVGLGSDLIRPQSLVLDAQGIYFDPSTPSELEEILNTVKFGEDELVRARQLRTYIVEHALTKYNLEPRQRAPWNSDGRKVILVPGQVEDDASIRYGCGEVNTNLGLLQAARSAEPEAFIVYKPHPDVVSGNRTGRLALARAREFADHIETQLSVVSCIEACDMVHTMSSLTGYDALL
ncbi:MAG TPA: capsular polysaccharide biosynthesis protein, partial [Gammaproteobacteria bacterium]